MGKTTGFLDYDRQAFKYRPVKERVKNYKEFTVPPSEAVLREQGARCMDCGVPFCHTGCPLGNIIPDFNDLVYEGDWDHALRKLLSTNNFPEFTGRICPAPCESACVLGINKPPVTIKNIEVAIIDRAFKEGKIRPRSDIKRSGKKVAVIGSGPAGLAAADQLNKAGHSITIFERADRAGGLLRYGIPDFKLEKSVVDRRVQLMEGEGVIFELNAHVGRNVPVQRLKQDFHAIVLAGGSTVPRDLPIPGRESPNVHFAMDFLKQSNQRVAGDKISKEEEISARGKQVLVIGGGDTGSDCVGTSFRQKAKSVTQIELLPKPPDQRDESTPWPLHSRLFKLTSSQEEGAKLDYSIMTKEFVLDEKKCLSSLKCVRLEWETGDNGAPRFREVSGSEFDIKADIVFLAMGFLHPEKPGMLEELGVALDPRGNVQCDQEYKTSVDGVFSAGDMRRGQSLVVWAISEGRECARSVDLYLRKGVTGLFSKNHSACEFSS